MKAPFLEKKIVSHETGKFVFLPNKTNAVSYLVRLLYVLQAVQWSQRTVISWDICSLITFHYHMRPFFRKWSLQELNKKLSHMILHTLLIIDFLQSAGGKLLVAYRFWKIFFGLLLTFLYSSSTSARFFMLISFPYTELQTFTFLCVSFSSRHLSAQYILVFRQSPSSFISVPFLFSLFSIITYFQTQS